MTRYILALDQGTTSSRAIVFNHSGRIAASAQQEFRQILPAPGIVEHDAEEIWNSQLAVARLALERAGITARDVAGIGITNQRETTILWDRRTGRPVSNAIVWQSRVSTPICQRLRDEGLEPVVRERTGLVVDAYFSGTKIRHLLDTIDGLQGAAERGDILFGTIDTWLLWKLSGGKLHVTDVSNASRTLLMNLATLEWDDEMLRMLNIPRAMLPEIRPSSEVYGETATEALGGVIPLAGCAGDQQAATFGQGCFEVGATKNTYGTGCFMLMNVGEKPAVSKYQLLSTVGWQVAGRTTYCLEGSVFIAGAAVQWLRDGLKLAETSVGIAELAASVADTDGVYFVPALTGLGAPYWDPHARGTIVGISRGTTSAHLCRAAIEAMAFQSRDLLEAMERDVGVKPPMLKVDGGASVNDLAMQFQADLIGTVVQRPVVSETTALGAAYLAGLAVGYWKDLDDVRRNWALEREFQPRLSPSAADALYANWQGAVARSRDWRPQ